MRLPHRGSAALLLLLVLAIPMEEGRGDEGMTEAERTEALERADELDRQIAALYRTGDFAAAAPLAREAVATREKARGPDHPLVAGSLVILARVLQKQGAYEEARSLFERALAIREKALGPDHPLTAESLGRVAAELLRQGEYGAARPLFERSLAIREPSQGPSVVCSKVVGYAAGLGSSAISRAFRTAYAFTSSASASSPTL